MKRSFLLLEVLIAIGLLTSVAAFLFDSPISFLKKEKSQIEEIAKARLYQQTIEEIRLLLFKNELPFAFNEKDKTIHKLSGKAFITLEGFKPLEVTRYYRLWFDTEETALGHFGQSFSLMHLEISFVLPLPGEKDFPEGQFKQAVFFVQQMPSDKNSNSLTAQSSL